MTYFATQSHKGSHSPTVIIVLCSGSVVALTPMIPSHSLIGQKCPGGGSNKIKTGKSLRCKMLKNKEQRYDCDVGHISDLDIGAEAEFNRG